MNGRVYDPILVRFLCPDNFVQAPGMSNTFNHYSYCINNPLKYADPSGEDLVGHEMAVHKVIYRSKNFWGRESLVVFAYDPGVRYYTEVNNIKVFKPITMVRYNFSRLPFSFIRFTLYNN